MSNELVFRIAAAGIQLRIVQRLKQIGIISHKRTLKEDKGDGNRYLILEVHGPQHSYDDIWKQVSKITGVLSLVKDISAHEDQPDEKETKQEIEPEASDAAVRDRMLIFSLLSRYPVVDGRFNEILSGIPLENRPQRAYKLGTGFGDYLARQINPKQLLLDLTDAMTHLLIPALSPMAKLQLDGNTLIINETSIDLKGRTHMIETCEFIKGTIKGLLKSCKMESLFVGNRCCQEHGGDSCHFLFAQG